MRAWLFAVVVVMGGCSDDDASGSDGFIPLGEAAMALKDAQCTFLVRCHQLPDHATCMSADIGAFGITSDAVAAIEAGRAYYNGANVKACADAIAAITCDTTDESGRLTPTACFQLVRGALSAGATCNSDVECRSQFCWVEHPGTTCATGVCMGDGPPIVVPGQLGGRCTRVSVGNLRCVAGTYCDESTRLCVPLRTEGMACLDTGECAYGLGCADGTCKRLPALAEPCPDGVCRDYGTVCNATNTCVQVGSDGDHCTSHTECSIFYPCDFVTSVCKRPGRLGESCTSDGRCFDADTFCDGQTCIGPLPDGAPCSRHTECAGGNCNAPQGVPGMCGAPPTCP